MRWIVLVVTLVACGGKDVVAPKTPADYCPINCDDTSPSAVVWDCLPTASCEPTARPSANVPACSEQWATAQVSVCHQTVHGPGCLSFPCKPHPSAP